MSISRSWESLWVWLFWAIGLYLVIELGPFLIAAWTLKKTAAELAGPYLAFAMPWAFLAPLIWWLRKREERGIEPKRLARGGGVSVALFGVAVAVASIYSGVKLGFMDPMDALAGLVGSVLLSVPIVYFTVYYTVIATASSRAAAKRGGTRPK